MLRAAGFLSMIGVAVVGCVVAGAADHKLRLEREANWLMIRGAHLPAGEIRINYLEAYCRPNSAKADWVKHTVIPHTSQLLSKNSDGSKMRIRDSLEDGVTVEHAVTVDGDAVTFRLTAHNPTASISEAHWAQPCVRLGSFTGHHPDHRVGDANDYLPKCFVFLDGQLARMPTKQWAREARYTPGQVWRPAYVPAADVNPRPLNPQIPSNGLIGCFSGDEKLIFATAWEPYQELFQGIARCIHSDFRLGGLAAGERKQIRGKIYIVPNDIPALLRRYYADFPEHVSAKR